MTGFANPIVAGDGALIRPAVISPDWDGDPADPLTDPGTVGWALPRTGQLIANAALIRGSLIAGTIDIPDTTTANSFHVSGTGRLWIGATTFAAAPFRVTNAGAVTATSVTITGGSVQGSTLAGTVDGSTVTIANLNASNITTGVLTGRTVRSAATSGARIELTNGNTLDFYSAASTLRMRMSQAGSVLTIGKVATALTIDLNADAIGLTCLVGAEISAGSAVDIIVNSVTAARFREVSTVPQAFLDGFVYAENLGGASPGADPALHYDTANGRIYYDSSTRRGKTDVAPLDVLAGVDVLPTLGRTFRRRGHPDAAPDFGAIAEDFAAVHPHLAVWGRANDDGTLSRDRRRKLTPVDWHTRGVVVALWDRVAALEQRLQSTP